MVENHKVEFLKNIYLFSSLTDEELKTTSSKVVLKKFKKNEIILFEEDTNKYMYLILAGRVKVTQMAQDGKETILAMHSTGGSFGEISLIDGKTVPATVSATEDSLLAIISKNDFYSLLYSHDKILEKLLQILCSRLRSSWKKIQVINFKNASQRVKTLFLMLSEEYGKKTPEGIRLNIKLTHQEIADMTGLTRETVTRVLDKCQKDGEITILKDRLICLGPRFSQKILEM